MMFKIPFRYMPSSWGLKGDAYLEAEAYYTLSGSALERRLANIRLRDDPKGLELAILKIDYSEGKLDRYAFDCQRAALEITDSNALKLRLLDIDAQHGLMSAYDAARAKAELTTEGMEREIALLDVEYEFGKISEPEHDKKRANLLKEPWIAIVNSGFDPDQGIDGVFFEFDWNAEWIEYLRLNGYVGHTDEQIVDDWFADVCRSYVATDMPSMPYPIAATRDV